MTVSLTALAPQCHKRLTSGSTWAGNPAGLLAQAVTKVVRPKYKHEGIFLLAM